MAIRDDELRALSFYDESKADRVVAFKILDPLNTLVKLDGGEQYIFNEEKYSLRRLPDPDHMTDEEYLRELGNTLERIMYHEGVSQVELADMTGIAQATISRYISGRSNPSYRNLDKIAKALGCSMDVFRFIEL